MPLKMTYGTGLRWILHAWLFAVTFLLPLTSHSILLGHVLNLQPEGQEAIDRCEAARYQIEDLELVEAMTIEGAVFIAVYGFGWCLFFIWISVRNWRNEPRSSVIDWVFGIFNAFSFNKLQNAAGTIVFLLACVAPLSIGITTGILNYYSIRSTEECHEADGTEMKVTKIIFFNLIISAMATITIFIWVILYTFVSSYQHAGKGQRYGALGQSEDVSSRPSGGNPLFSQQPINRRTA